MPPGSMTVILREAIKPNLMQTLENTPALVHTGPFGNIATGNSSIVADQIGIHMSDFLLTEAGFGADMGAERFFNIKCRYSGIAPDAAVLVATVRGLKAHSGNHRIVAGQPAARRPSAGREPRRGPPGRRQPPQAAGQHAAPRSYPGGGHQRLPRRPRGRPRRHRRDRRRIRRPVPRSPPTSPTAGPVRPSWPRRSRRRPRSPRRSRSSTPTTCRWPTRSTPWRPRSTEPTASSSRPTAKRQLDTYTSAGFGHLPVCIAKTHLSISSDPALKGAPTGWTLPVREVRASVGAGFVYPICGDMRTMPGLGRTPAAKGIDLVFDDGDPEGRIVGLS